MIWGAISLRAFILLSPKVNIFIMLTAWALAGIAGPMLLSVIKETTGSYHQTMLVFAGLMAAALVLSVILKVKSTKH